MMKKLPAFLLMLALVLMAAPTVWAQQEDQDDPPRPADVRDEAPPAPRDAQDDLPPAPRDARDDRPPAPRDARDDRPPPPRDDRRFDEGRSPSDAPPRLDGDRTIRGYGPGQAPGKGPWQGPQQAPMQAPPKGGDYGPPGQAPDKGGYQAPMQAPGKGAYQAPMQAPHKGAEYGGGQHFTGYAPHCAGCPQPGYQAGYGYTSAPRVARRGLFGRWR